MDGDEVSYETLQDMLRQEKRSNRLTKVSDGFWRAMQKFLDDTESEFLGEQGKDPFSRKASMLRDRVVHAQQAADAVWTLRERKIAMLALAHVREGGSPKGLTKKERVLYDGLLEMLAAARQGVFPGTAIPKPITPAVEAVPTPQEEIKQEKQEVERPEEPVISPSESEEKVAGEEAKTAPATVPPDIPDDGQVTIEALGDIPPFVGPDMKTYNLKAGDMANVPENIASLLVKRNKAKIVQTV